MQGVWYHTLCCEVCCRHDRFHFPIALRTYAQESHGTHDSFMRLEVHDVVGFTCTLSPVRASVVVNGRIVRERSMLES